VAGTQADAARHGSVLPGPPNGDHCRFFSLDFLCASGFALVEEAHGLMLMRLELGGIVTILGQVKAAVKQLLGNEPTPSPAAWSGHQTT
jgi:hypothetical protein